MFQAVILCNLQENLWTKLEKMVKKTNYGSNFSPNMGSKNFFWVLPLEDFIYCCKLSLYAISRKTWENSVETNFRLNCDSFGTNLAPKFFSPVFPPLDIRHPCKLSLYTISRKTNVPNPRKWQKTQKTCWVQIRAAKFFQKCSSVTHKISWSVIIMYNIRKN